MQGRNMNAKNINNLSRALTKLLRHDAQSQGLFIRPDGFIPLAEIMRVKYVSKFKPTMLDIEDVVNDNDKKRLDLQEVEGQWMLRAVQGHTISDVLDEDLLTRITNDINEPENVFNYAEVFHGTYRKVLDLVMKSGLCRMARNHVHMAVGLPGANQVISGMRSSCQIAFEVNMIAASLGADIPFYVSQNRVVLCSGQGEKGLIPPSTFRSVFDTQSGLYIYQKPLDYICVYDLECNCSEEKGAIKFNETIELPVVIIDVKQKKVVAEFHTYVRPTAEDKITPFCTELTGIT